MSLGRGGERGVLQPPPNTQRGEVSETSIITMITRPSITSRLLIPGRIQIIHAYEITKNIHHSTVIIVSVCSENSPVSVFYFYYFLRFLKIRYRSPLYLEYLLLSVFLVGP